MEHPPRSDYQNVSEFNTRAQVRQATIPPLFCVPKTRRLKLWTALLTEDVFASFFGTSQDVVDVQ